jgi:hypothetical protein
VRCGKCGRPLYVDVNRYRCASGPGLGCGGVAVRSDMLEEYVTGAVLDALESPRVQQAVTAGADTDALRRAELLAEIRKAQDKRAEARRDWAEDVIDKEDWLDIKQRTDDRINRAAPNTTGSPAPRPCSATSPSHAVRDAWEQWNTDRRRAAVKAVLNRVTVSPDSPGRKGSRDRALRMEALRQQTEFDWRLW